MATSDLTPRRYTEGLPSGTAPAVEEFLRERGVPTQVITIFQAADALHGLETDDGKPRPGIVIGYSREEEQIYVDPASGQVFLLASWAGDVPLIVNRDLPSFAASLAYIAERYPFTLPVKDVESASLLSDELRAHLVEIDPTCVLEPDGFWAPFLEDVAVGDYS
jgi:hypothetical protein